MLIALVALTFNGHAQTYCASSGSAGSTFYIGQTCLQSNFPNCENCCAIPGSYTDETGRAPITIFTPNSTTNDQLSVGYNTNAGGLQNYTYAFYIDLNIDGDFNDPNELVNSGSGNINFPTGGGGSLNATPMIPMSATNGITRMRFIVKNGTTPVAGPCETGFDGETEDWPVEISGAGVVGDTTPPNAVCQNVTVQLNASGNASVTAAQVDGGSTDDTGITSRSVSPSSFTCSNIGGNTVTLTVMDAAGNMDTCTATVTVQDNIAPSITCASNGTRNVDSGSNMYTVVGNEFDPTASSDNCPPITITNNVNGTTTLAGESFPVGDTVITWSVDDGNGQITSCIVTISVQFDSNPMVPGTGADDTFTIVLDGADVVVINGGMELLRQPSASTSSLTLNGAGGNDSATTDYSGGTFGFPIIFNGGSQSGAPGDVLTVTGATFTTQTLNYDVPGADGNNGNIDLDGSTITYTGLEPINAGDAANTILNLPSAVANNATLQNSANAGEIEIVDNGATFEDTVIPNPTSTLTINLGDSGDILNVNTLDAAYAASLIINGGLATTDSVQLTDVDIDSGNTGRGLYVTETETLNISGGTITNNTATIGGGILVDNSTSGIATTTTISGTIISNNTASRGGGILNNGGIMNIGASTSIISNAASFRSGGIENFGGTLNVFGTISGNIATGSGGGVLSQGGTLTIDGATLSGNQAGFVGGGLQIEAGATVTVSNNTSFTGNLASVNGGAVNFGGGSLTISDATISGNSAGSNGGGIFFDLGTLSLTNTSIDGNTASGSGATEGGGGIYLNSGRTLTLDNSVNITNNIANGTSGSGGGIFMSTGASLSATGTIINGNRANRAGGGIEDNSGAGLNLTLINVTLNNNNTGVAPAVANPGNGGGLHITGAGDASITGGTVNGNLAAREGGGLWNGTGTMTVTDVSINGNDAQGAGADDGGGGIFNNGGTLIVDGTSTIVGNIASGAAGSGGGIFTLGGSLTVDNISISGNSANRAGGGIEINGGTSYTFNNLVLNTNSITTPNPGNGGGLHITGPANTTFNGGSIINNSANEGGGLWNGSGLMDINGTIITGNSALGPNTGGGGIFNLGGGTVDIDAATTLTGNIASGATPGGRGGAIFNNTNGSLVLASGLTINGNYASRAGGAIEDTSGGLLLLNGVTMQGNAAGVDIGLGNTITANPGNGGALHLSGTTSATVDLFSNISNNLAASEGGGLWNNLGTLTVNLPIMDGNIASGDDATNGGGAIFNNGGTLDVNGGAYSNNVADGISGSGGAIMSVDGAVTITDVVMAFNTSNRAGGAIELIDGTLTVDGNYNLSQNNAGANPGNGGAVHISGTANSTFIGGLIQNNIAGREGGGLWNNTGLMTVTGTQIDANDAQGGAAADDGGGGIFNNGGTVTVDGGSTITNNTASGSTLGSGGGILNLNGTLNLDGISVTGNTSNRAGGGIEINVAATTTSTFTNITLDGNNAGTSPGNGGGLHITGPGNVTLNGGSVTNNIANEGGGLWNGSGLMDINGTTITDNSALGSNTGGGGIFNNGNGTVDVDAATTLSTNIAMGATPGGRGGAIFNNTNGVLALASGLSITGNYASRAGGAIEDASNGILTLNGITMSGNTAGVDIGLGTMANPGNGGALHLSGTTNANITGSTISNNQAALEGGGLWNNAGTMVVSSTTVSGNTAQGDAADDGGGGIFNNGGTLTLVGNSVLISNNTASGTSGSGGGIFSTDGTVTMGQAIIEDNSANRAGGGIELINGTLNGTGTRLRNNDVNGGAGIPNPGNGGGFHVTGVATITFNNSIVSGNDAASEGGGLWNQAGTTMNVIATQIVNNEALGAAADNGGGGIFNNGGTLNISTGAGPSTLINNRATGTAGSGGGLFSTDGAVTIGASTVITGNRANRAGGGIEIINGDLDLTDVTLDNNNAGVAPATAAPGNGGGLHITGTANATITGGTVDSNVAASEGGGLWNGTGTMTVDAVPVTNNTASGAAADNGGGGIFNNGGTLDVLAGTSITDNVADGAAGSGGGIFSTNGAVTVTDATITNNTANRAGGGIELIEGSLIMSGTTLDTNNAGVAPATAAPGNGGGLHITGAANATITGGTVDSNVAASEGGGLWNGTGTMTVDAVPVTNNIASGAAADNGGGGIFNNGGTLDVLSGTTINNNFANGTAGSGGGIFSTNGTVTIADITIFSNYANRAGGAIEVIDGALNLNGTVVAFNDVNGTAGTPAPGNGGGIHISGITTTNINNAVISANQAAREGGGLWNQAGSTMNVFDTMVNINSASGSAADDGGGGIFNNGGNLGIVNGTVQNNIANGTSGSGGGLFSTAGTVAIIGGMIDNNAANRAGGGIEIVDGTLDMFNTSLITNSVDGSAGTPAPGNGGGMHVTGTATINIAGATISGNDAASEGGGLWNQSGSTMTVDSSILDGNTAGGDDPTNGGGGIFNNGGVLMVQNFTTISNNVATGLAGSGGGILNVDGGTVVVNNTTIENNSAKRAGGGIEDNSSVAVGSITLFNVNLDNNATASAPGNGGGLHMTGPGTSTITNGTVNGNSAALEGGGLWNGSGSMTVNNTTIDGNTASGAAANEGGGGIFNAGGTLTVTNATITNNIANGAAGSGGGILNDMGTLTVTDTELSGNTSMRAGGGIEVASGGNLLTLTNVDLLNN
ncbi:MAG: hypothetical protein CL605_11900, partial [Altibacter sp.]|nr:hypothetical protein [Altibacter sp.]